MRSQADAGDLLCCIVVAAVSIITRSPFPISTTAGRNHRERIVLFGRFPERNRYLGRVTTADEAVYMTSIYPDG